MPRSAKDIRFTELKDTILQLNELIVTQTKSMESLNRTIEELRQELVNKQAEVDYRKAKLFGVSSEKLKASFPGQMNLFQELLPDTGKRERKAKATYEELFENLPCRQVLLDTLTEEDKTCPVCEARIVPSELRLHGRSSCSILHIWNGWSILQPPMSVLPAKTWKNRSL